MEWEVRYNYSGVKNFWRKIREKNTRPFRFWQNDFYFQSRFFSRTEPKKRQCHFIAFSIWKRMFSFALPQICYFKIKGIDKNILCRLTNHQINLKGCILSHQIFSLTYLLVYYLSVGLYSFYSRARFCKVYLCCFVAPLILFLCFLLSYSS